MKNGIFYIYDKTKEELNTLKIEYETLCNKLKELEDDELVLVTGGSDITVLEVDGVAKITETSEGRLSK